MFFLNRPFEIIRKKRARRLVHVLWVFLTILINLPYFCQAYLEFKKFDSLLDVVNRPVLAWWNDSWDYRIKYQIDNSGVGETLTDFPLHIDLTNDAPANFWANVDSDGDDIRIVNEDDSTDLTSQAHLEGWNSTNETGHIWVKRTIAASGNDEFVYIYYGNSSASSSWNESSSYNSDYKAVWHFSESSGSRYDSTSNNNDLSDNNTVTSASGAIGMAADFERNNTEYLSIADASQTGLEFAGDYTIEMWISFESTTGNAALMSKFKIQNPNAQSEGFEVHCTWVTNNFYIGTEHMHSWSSSNIYSDITASQATPTWRQIAIVFDDSEDEITFCLDGTCESALTMNKTQTGNSQPIWIGNNQDWSHRFDGKMDEIRVSDMVRSGEWLEFSYLSDSGDSGTFSDEEIGQGSTSSAATAYSFQRKTWYDGSRYWKAFHNGSAIVFEYSTDGETWTKNDSAEISVSTNDFSIEADSSNAFIVYTDGYDVKAVKASSYPGISFTWGTAITVYDGNLDSDKYYYPAITKESGGNLWVQSSYYGSSTYNIYVRRSSSANDISSWATASGLDSSSNSNKYGSIISLGSGNMYSAWIDGFGIEGKKFNGSNWDGSPTSIATGTTGMSNNISLSADSGGEGHIVYIDSSGYVKYQRYTTSWQSAVTLDSNGSCEYVTVSLIDSATDKLFAFWERGDDIYYSAASSPYSSWLTAAALVDSGTNQSLVGSYADNSSSQAFVAWTQGSSSPYSIGWELAPSTNSSPNSPQSPFANNDNAQSGQSSPVSGLIDHTPAFSAIFDDDDDTSDTSSYYEVEVGDDDDWGDAAELWDSGKTAMSSCNENSRCADITYAGSSLSDGSTYYWRIRFWDNSDDQGSWSATSQFTMNNSPTISSVVLNGSSSINLEAGTTKAVSWAGTITDLDGYEDIASALGKVYRSGITEECSLDDENCYQDASCDLTDCAGNSCTVTCGASLYFFAESTDSYSSYPDQYWRGWVEATDDRTETGEGFSGVDLVDVNSLFAINITSSISYGQMVVGEDSESSNETTTITNEGNIAIDLEVSGDNMCTDYSTCEGYLLGVVNQEFKATVFTYGDGTDLALTIENLDFNLSKPTESPSNSSDNLYWGIGIPEGIEAGAYTGANTINAKVNE